MGWARFDDGYADHPKVKAAGSLAMALDVRAILHCARYETDGVVVAALLPTLAVGIPRVKVHVARLVEVGRWHLPGHTCPRCPQTSDGWVVHDFLTYNPSKATREADRHAARERMAKARGSPDVRPNTSRSSAAVRDVFGLPRPLPVVPSEQERARSDAVDNHPPEPTTADIAEAVEARQDLRRKFRPNDVLTGGDRRTT